MDFVDEILDGLDGVGADDYGRSPAKEMPANAKQYKSKNLETERRRRLRLKQNLYSLRSLVPNISKMSKESTLTDAIDYIKDLEHEIAELQMELLDVPDEEAEQHSTKVKTSTKAPPETLDFKGEVEVSSIGLNKMCVKIVCRNRPAGFAELMEAIANLGLEAVSVNFAMLDSVCEIVLYVEAKSNNPVVAAAQVRELLQKVV